MPKTVMKTVTVVPEEWSFWGDDGPSGTSGSYQIKGTVSGGDFPTGSRVEVWTGSKAAGEVVTYQRGRPMVFRFPEAAAHQEPDGTTKICGFRRRHVSVSVRFVPDSNS